MSLSALINEVPWDTVTLGMPSRELKVYSLDAVKQALKSPGHYVVRVDPLANKKILYEHGFYYCDTLIEPYCDAHRLLRVHYPNAKISKDINVEQALDICHNAFTHGRFHRDFQIPKPAADLRYEKWLVQLIDEKKVYGLFWQGELVGFLGHSDNNIILNAMAAQYRGKGLMKFLWSSVCEELLKMGYENIKSSISTTNMPILNLCATLGFLFGNPKDIYHCVVK